MPEMDTLQSKNYGIGKFRFVLHRGPTGVFGHVELTLQSMPEPGQISIQWKVESNNHDVDARKEVERAAIEYLSGYVIDHPEYGLLATITEVTSDPERRNDYDRATKIALRWALEDMSLPVPQIFGP